MCSVLVLSGTIYAQDQIVKTSGEELFGKVIRVNNLDVVYKKKDNPDGPEYSELKSNILFVKYENGQKEIFTTANMPVVRDVSAICEPLKRKNSIFVEAGGNGLVASLNYERKFFSNRNNNFVAIKAGIGPFATISILNITSTYNIGDGMNFFEAGGGVGGFTNQLFDENSGRSDYSFVYFTPIIGYRRQSAKGFLLKTFITTFSDRRRETTFVKTGTVINPYSGYSYDTGYYSSEDYIQYFPFLGVSVGFSF